MLVPLVFPQFPLVSYGVFVSSVEGDAIMCRVLTLLAIRSMSCGCSKPGIAMPGWSLVQLASVCCVGVYTERRLNGNEGLGFSL